MRRLMRCPRIISENFANLMGHGEWRYSFDAARTADNKYYSPQFELIGFLYASGYSKQVNVESFANSGQPSIQLLKDFKVPVSLAALTAMPDLCSCGLL